MRACWGLAVLAIASVVRADPAGDRFAEGRALLDQGKPAEACAKFDAALELAPDAAGVLLNLGLCNVQQHKVATALKWFRKAAASGQDEVVAAANQQITTLSSLVPTVRIEAAGAVAIDGTPADTRAPIEIDAGHHVATIGGVDRPFDVEEGARAQVIDLRPPPPPHRSSAPWIVGGIGAGLVVGSGALSLVGKSQFDSAHDLDTRKQWKSIVHLGSTAMFATGCVALGVATVLYVRGRHDEHTVVAPVVTPDQAGVSLVGAF
jgi:tetratricopeptide (TPR) repeat protein